MFSDSFVRANENPLSDGGAWFAAPTSWSAMQITSNQAVNTAGNCAQYVSTPVFTANHTATTTVEGTSGLGPLVRLSANGTGYLLYMAGATTIQVYKASSSSSLTQIGSDYTVSLSNGNTIGLGISGTTITVYVNGVAQTPTITDATYSTGFPGIFSNGPGGANGPFTATSP